MFTTLALAALTIAPAQGGTLKLTNVRLTIGELGPKEPLEDRGEVVAVGRRDEERVACPVRGGDGLFDESNGGVGFLRGGLEPQPELRLSVAGADE